MLEVKKKHINWVAIDMSAFAFSGERGIRTPGTLTSTPVFKTGSFDHSDISPRLSSLL